MYGCEVFKKLFFSVVGGEQRLSFKESVVPGASRNPRL